MALACSPSSKYKSPSTSSAPASVGASCNAWRNAARAASICPRRCADRADITSAPAFSAICISSNVNTGTGLGGIFEAADADGGFATVVVTTAAFVATGPAAGAPNGTVPFAHNPFFETVGTACGASPAAGLAVDATVAAAAGAPIETATGACSTTGG